MKAPHQRGPKRHLAPTRELIFQNPCRYPEAGARRHRDWVDRLLEDVADSPGSFVVRFVSDREMRQLNETYRQKAKTTDVLSFPGEDRTGQDGLAEEVPGEPHLGDVVISVPQARRQAAERGHTTDREIRLLILHGLLHCLGHDHETDNGTMVRLEARLRRRFLPPVETLRAS